VKEASVAKGKRVVKLWWADGAACDIHVRVRAVETQDAPGLVGDAVRLARRMLTKGETGHRVQEFCAGNLQVAVATNPEVSAPAPSPRKLHIWTRIRQGSQESCSICGARRSTSKLRRGGSAYMYLAPGLDPKVSAAWTKARPNCTGRRSHA
jgi:hypothetical protein